jgi:hypothetical protein
MHRLWFRPKGSAVVDTAVGALGLCCAAWLITATILTLDLLGRLPPRLRRGRNTRAVRLQTTAGLAVMSGVVVTQLAALWNWPRALRETLDLMDVPLGLAVIACAIIAFAIRSRPDHVKDAEIHSSD